MTTQSATIHAEEPGRGLWASALVADSPALRTLASRFWPAIYTWWRSVGLGPKKAAIATLACFERWLGSDPPKDTHEGSLRMRDWVLAQLTDLASRGVKLLGHPPIEVDWDAAARRYDQEPVLSPDDLYQRRWALTVFESVAAALRAEYAAAGQTVRLAWLIPFLHVREVDEAQFSAVTARTGITFGAVRIAVADFRKRHRYLLSMAVADTVATPAEIDSELAALLCNSAIGVEGEAAAITQIAGPPTVVPMRNSNTTGTWKWEPPSLAAAAKLFPNYEIIEMIGRGGMGVVYKAQQTALERFVAIKLLPLEVSANGAFAERFEREAKTLAKLNHPNIVAVHDFGKTSGGHLFFVMEFIHGTNLWQLVHGVGIDPVQSMEIMGCVCDALQYAHSKGVVHRDVKPANVLLDTEGRIKVADFGLARMNTHNAGPALSGPVMGTPEYMAPEHLRDENVDHRADIYSLGVMLYEMLCRDVPRGAFDLPSRRTTVDPRVDAVVIKAMQQVPDRRFQSTGEMKYAIDMIRTGPVTSLPTPRPVPATAPVPRMPPPSEVPSRGGLVLFVLVCVIAASIAAAVYFYPPDKPPSGPGGNAANLAQPPATQPKVDARDEFDPVNFANSRYQLMPGAVSWSEAKSRAEKLGGHLVVIDSLAEDDFLRTTYASTLANTDRLIHIGAYRSSDSGGWKWVNGQEWKYTGWAPKEPAHANAAPASMPLYAVLSRKSGKVAWNARLTSDEVKATFKSECRGFLIEWDIESVSPPVVVAVSKPPEPAPVPEPAPAPAETIPVPPANPPQPVAAPPSEFTTWLAARNAEWQVIYDREVAAPHKKAIEDAKAAYFTLLDRQLNLVSKANNLEAALALRNERQRMTTGGEIPAEDEALIPDNVKKMRADVRARIAKADRDRELRAKAVFAQYDQFLKQTQTKLTTTERIDDAETVKKLRDEVASNWVKSSSPAAGSPDKPPAQGPIKRSSRIPKRKLVEQLLARNAAVSIREKAGKTLELTSSSALSDDEFQITLVHFRSSQEKPEWKEEDTALLDNVLDVPELGFFGVAATDAVLERIRGCREITTLRLANLTQLTPASALVIPTLTGLQTIALSNLPWPADSLKSVAQNRKIDNVELQNTALSDDAFAALCNLPALERIELTGVIRGMTEAGWQGLGAARRLKTIEITGGDLNVKVAGHMARASSLESVKIIASPVTDADVLPLSTLPKLHSLVLERTKVSGTGFAGWPQRPAMNHLDLRGAGRVDEASLKAICSAFPKVEALEFTASKGQLTAAASAHLGRLRAIRTLRIHGDAVTDECAFEIAKADTLEELNVGNSVITEVGLAALCKMDRLSRLHLFSPVISDATLKSLGKFRGLNELIVGSVTTDDTVRRLRTALPGVTVRH